MISQIWAQLKSGPERDSTVWYPLYKMLQVERVSDFLIPILYTFKIHNNS
jgi:hypothetical protein